VSPQNFLVVFFIHFFKTLYLRSERLPTRDTIYFIILGPLTGSHGIYRIYATVCQCQEDIPQEGLPPRDTRWITHKTPCMSTTACFQDANLQTPEAH
jgi:hypothetical protein